MKILPFFPKVFKFSLIFRQNLVKIWKYALIWGSGPETKKQRNYEKLRVKINGNLQCVENHINYDRSFDFQTPI